MTNLAAELRRNAKSPGTTSRLASPTPILRFWTCRVGLTLWLTAVGITGGLAAENLARLATVSGPGQEPHAVVDGVKQQAGTGEWIGESPNEWFGWIHYPQNLALKWETPRRINKVVLYDRPTLEEHLAACVLTFSDGSKVDEIGRAHV